MLKEIEKLPASEIELLIKAPLLVCILIAGADGEIDKKEIRSAIELAKSAKTKANISEFYLMVAEDFEDKLKFILQALPKKAEQRNKQVQEELSKLNGILPHVAKSFSSDYYRSLLHVAREIAESSGGLLGIKSVGEEESELINLPMIKNPVS